MNSLVEVCPSISTPLTRGKSTTGDTAWMGITNSQIHFKSCIGAGFARACVHSVIPEELVWQTGFGFVAVPFAFARASSAFLVFQATQCGVAKENRHEQSNIKHRCHWQKDEEYKDGTKCPPFTPAHTDLDSSNSAN